MKKFLPIIIFIVFSLVFGFILEIVSYNFLYGYLRPKTLINIGESTAGYKIFSIKKPDILNFEYFLSERNNDHLKYNENLRPILLLGCSYAYGQGINVDKNFSSQLQKKTNRKTFNYSKMGASPADLLRSTSILAKNGTLKKDNFQYVIYVVMYDHFLRINDLSLFCDFLTKTYQTNKNRSFKDKLKYYADFSYTAKLFNAKRLTEKNNVALKINFLKYQINETNKIIKKNIPDAKFVVLLYDDVTNPSKDAYFYNDKTIHISLNKDTYSDLEKSGIIFISTKSLVGDVLCDEYYQIKNDEFQYWKPHHPNEKAWELIIPPFCNKLRL